MITQEHIAAPCGLAPEQHAALLDRLTRIGDATPEDTIIAQALLALMHRVAALEAAAPRSRFTPPTAAEVEDYARSIGFSVDGQYFCDHYEKTGWVIGKAKIKSWQACVRTWKKNGAGGGAPCARKGAVMR